MHDTEFYADITFSYKQVNFLRLPLSGGSFIIGKKIFYLYAFEAYRTIRHRYLRKRMTDSRIETGKL